MMFRPLWIEINLAALRHNFKLLKRIAGKSNGIIAAVKQNAYGHGLLLVAKELSKLKVNFFALESIEEAILLREKGFKQPILILTAVSPKFAWAFVSYNLTPTIVDFNFAEKLSKVARTKKKVVNAHVKVDTGMGRLGYWTKGSAVLIHKLKKLKNIRLVGIYTHFPVADTDKKYTNNQIKKFKEFIKQLRSKGLRFKYQHCANSAGLIDYPQSHFNMVRPGLALYGIKPSDKEKIDLKPILNLKTRVVFIKKFNKGDTVSYGCTYRVKKPCRIATISVGYGDGYQRALSNKAKVLIRNKAFKICGRICMDHAMVDLGDNKTIRVGDEVVLIGSSRDHSITAQNLADLAKTIPYEITTCFSTRIPRIAV